MLVVDRKILPRVRTLEPGGLLPYLMEGLCMCDYVVVSREKDCPGGPEGSRTGSCKREARSKAAEGAVRATAEMG
jgi:hypothetical protein